VGCPTFLGKQKRKRWVGGPTQKKTPWLRGPRGPPGTGEEGGSKDWGLKGKNESAEFSGQDLRKRVESDPIGKKRKGRRSRKRRKSAFTRDYFHAFY